MKWQTPTIGGVRKVIKTTNTVSGTTIAELGNNTITLAQLAAIITQIQAQQQNNGGGNIGGGGSGGTIVLGPGLTGGGPLVGNVPIRLTAPIPWGLEDIGADGDMGPPGIQGVMGSQGPQGIPGTSGTGSGSGLLMWVPEENWPDDPTIPGPAGPAGAAGAVGATGPQGPAGTGTGGGAGTLSMWVPEENWPDDPWYRMPSQLGFLTVNGPLIGNGITTLNAALIASGPATFNSSVNGLTTVAFSNAANAAITFPGNNPIIQTTAASLTLQTVAAVSVFSNSVTVASFSNSNGNTFGNVAVGSVTATISGQSTVSASRGLLIQSGTNTTDYALLVKNNNATSQFFEIAGDGSATLGTSTLAFKGIGTLNAQGYFLNGAPLFQGGNANSVTPAHGMIVDDNYGDDQGFLVPQPTSLGPLKVVGPFQIASPTPPATPGITALGTTTTVTVITTAGGIALPALASLFGVINWNGVAYGVPLFAL
jgi:hypothetical protein